MGNLVVYIPARLERELAPMTKADMRETCVAALREACPRYDDKALHRRGLKRSRLSKPSPSAPCS